MSTAALRVAGLEARVASGPLLTDIHFELPAGRALAVVGESGAGKSTLGLALTGSARAGVRLRGSVHVDGVDLLGPGHESTDRRAPVARIGYLPQHPATVLDPIRRVGSVLHELAAAAYGPDPAARSDAVDFALRAAQLTTTAGLTRRFPHQLSGGQQQRVALAMTLVRRPPIIVLDEPTTGLDRETTDALISDLARLTAQGTALVILTHDLTLARALAHDTIVLHAGRIVRSGPTAEILSESTSSSAEPTTTTAPPRLAARDLTVTERRGRPILDRVTLDAAPGEVLTLMGRSGAGKTTLARALAGLVAPQQGTIELDGHVLPPNALDRDRATRRAVQYVHQDPQTTFLVRRPVLDQVARPAVLLRGLTPAAARDEALHLLDALGLGADIVARRSRELSGGQLQRAAVARALLADPAVLVGDEITAALDARHRDLVVRELERRLAHGTAIVLVTHDLDLATRLPGTTMMLSAGQVTEHGPTDQVITAALA